MAFTAKRVHCAGSMGEDLRDLRIRAGWSLSQATHALKFTESFLRALEEDRWHEIPDPASVERMLKAYVVFLGGNATYYLDKYRECLRARSMERKPEDHLPRPSRVRFLELSVGPRWIAAGIFVLFLGVIGAYVFFQAKTITSKPMLIVDEPAEGLRLDAPRVTVRGRTSPEASVAVNGNKTVVQPDGSFVTELDVARGVTPITVAARKRYGAEIVEIRRVIYERSVPLNIPAFATSTE